MKSKRSRNWAQHGYKMIHPLRSFNTCLLSCQNFDGNVLPQCHHMTCNDWCVSVVQGQCVYTLRSTSKGIHLEMRHDICMLLCMDLIGDGSLFVHDWKNFGIIIFQHVMPCSLIHTCCSTQYHNPEVIKFNIHHCNNHKPHVRRKIPVPFHYSTCCYYHSRQRQQGKLGIGGGGIVKYSRVISCVSSQQT